MEDIANKPHLYQLTEQILDRANGVLVTPTGEEFLVLIEKGGIFAPHPSLLIQGWDCRRVTDKLGRYLPVPENWRNYIQSELIME